MPFQSNPPTEREKMDFSNKDKFIYNIRKLPKFDVKLSGLGRRTYRCKSCGFENVVYEQKRVDILIAVDIVRLSWQRVVDNIVLVVGDSDFIPAISNAKEAGLITKLFYSNYSVHDELLMECDDVYEIDEMLITSSLLAKNEVVDI